MKQQPFIFLLFNVCFTLLVLQACNQRKGIPYDESKVQEHIISIKRAQAYTASYRGGITDLSRRINDSVYLKNGFQLPVAVQFNRDVLALLLSQKDSAGNFAEGVRMYFGRDDRNQVTLVLVPHDRSNNDIISNLIQKDVARFPGITPAFAFQLQQQAADNALRCPTFCDQLNSGLGGDIIYEFPGN